jgi:PST family polysaccharide transporter
VSDDLRLAAAGIRWNYLGSGAILATQVLYTALTARLVSPAGFGAYAVAQALVGLVGYFGLATLGSALIRHDTYSRVAAGTAFILSAGAGFGAAIMVIWTAAPWSQAWGVSDSASLCRLFSAAVMMSALSVVPLAVLRKQLRFRRVAAIESLSQIAGMCIGAGTAVAMRTPEALVIGQGAAATTAFLSSFIATRREMAFAFSRKEATTLLRFSGHVSGQSFVYFGIYTLPSLFVSRMFGATALGGYSRANLLVTLPVTHLWAGVTKTLYPLVARARSEGARIRALLEDTLLTVTGICWPLFAFVAGASPLVVVILLGDQWSGVSELLPPILLFGAINLAYVVSGNPLEVLGFQRLIWRFQFAWAILLVAICVGAYFGNASITTLLWAVAGVHIVIHGGKILVTERLGLLDLGVVLRGYAATALVSLPFFLAAAAVERVIARPSGTAIGATCELLTLLTLTLAIGLLFPSLPLGSAVRSGMGRVFGGRALGVGRNLRSDAQMQGDM